jgi:plastocyanin
MMIGIVFLGMIKSKTGLSTLSAIALILIMLIATIGAVAIFNIIYTAQQPTASTTITTTQTMIGLDQPPVNTYITMTWEKSPQALQDRFTPPNIIVAQGDIIHITFIVNDTSGHTFTIGPPYSFQINDSIPGLTNDLTGVKFSTQSTHNSQGVVVLGTPGNLTGRGTFVAKYAGVFEYFCIYHVQIGMFGYLTVLPNLAYNTTTTTQTSTAPSNQVSINYGSGTNTTTTYFSPKVITVIIGVNNTVTWINNDVVPHTVTSDTLLFDSGPISQGATYSYTFTTPGNYSYHCSYHMWMRGMVIVKSG